MQGKGQGNGASKPLISAEKVEISVVITFLQLWVPESFHHGKSHPVLLSCSVPAQSSLFPCKYPLQTGLLLLRKSVLID